MRCFMRGSVCLSLKVGVSVLAVVLLVAGCTGGRRRGGGPYVPTDGGGSDGHVTMPDLGPAPDGYVPPAPVCGDWTVDEGEQCDDGNRTSGDGCDSSCQLETPASCGDYTVNDGEECDDGPSGSELCDSDCTLAMCGDRVVNSAAGEDCDAGSSGSATCDRDCTYVLCGDGLLNAAAGEACDDANPYAADGCSASCAVEAGWTCTGAPSSCTRMGGGTIDRSASPALSIPDANTTGVTSTISLTGAPASTCTVDTLTVDVDITHTYIGDLTVTLTSPGGTPVILHSVSGGTADNIVGNYPTTLTPYGLLSDVSGEPALGTWSLHVVDGSSTDTGTLNTWGVHITCI